ncbi:hypothetical protein [Haliscomenobacter sp.]|uniref:hypothetical protein n=1 Tax=Haliscomenobacter sp. TaxID=2717303 RepID=UPI003364CF80
MKLLITSTLFLSLFSLGLNSCANEPKIAQSDLLGRWEIKEAYRNEKNAEDDMQGLFFEFFGDGKMLTNMSSSTTEAQFELKKQTIFQRGGEMDADYQIASLTDTSMVLVTVLRDYNFRFVLKKSIQMN